MTRIAGMHAVITGGSEGIGKAVAAAARARGARVSIIGRSRTKLDAAVAELGADVASAAADVTDPDALDSAFVALVDRHGPCDILVTSAGGAEPGYFEALDADVFRRQMEVNYLGTLHALRCVVPSMRERGRGHVVLLSSAAGLIGVFGYSAYCPTKFAVRGLGETLRGELAPHGVRVSIVYPPDTDTPGLEREDATKPEETRRISATIAVRPAEKVAAAVVSGIERDRLTITADASTAALARASGLLGPALRWQADRIVRRVRAGRAGRAH